MLILVRRVDEKIKIGDEVTITVVAVNGSTVRLGIDAPVSIPVYREELYQKIKRAEASQRGSALSVESVPTEAEVW